MEQPIDYPDLWKVLQKASQDMGLPHVIATSQSIHLTVQVGDESKGLRFLLRFSHGGIGRTIPLFPMAYAWSWSHGLMDCPNRVCLKMVSTPLYPMVLLIILPMKNGYFTGGIPHFQTCP